MILVSPSTVSFCAFFQRKNNELSIIQYIPLILERNIKHQYFEPLILHSHLDGRKVRQISVKNIHLDHAKVLTNQ